MKTKARGMKEANDQFCPAYPPRIVEQPLAPILFILAMRSKPATLAYEKQREIQQGITQTGEGLQRPLAWGAEK